MLLREVLSEDKCESQQIVANSAKVGDLPSKLTRCIHLVHHLCGCRTDNIGDRGEGREKDTCFALTDRDSTKKHLLLPQQKKIPITSNHVCYPGHVQIATAADSKSMPPESFESTTRI